MEPTVVVAIISAIVTLVTAFLSSPLLLALVNKTPPQVQSAAEMGMSGTLLPNNPESTPSEGLTKAFTEPSQNAPVDFTPLPTIEPTDNPTSEPPTATMSASGAATDLPPVPENTPVLMPTTVSPLLSCFALEVWFPYPATLNPGVPDGCWNLAEWGFSTNQGQLFLVHNPAQDQQRGVYLPISGDAAIQFTLQMNEFRTRSNDGGFLHFGIVQDAPFSNYNGGYLSYQQPSPGASSPIRVLVNGTNQGTQTVLTLEKGFQQAIRLSVEGDLLVVFLDNVPAGEPISLPRADRAFWIGYVLPGKAELDVSLTDFVVTPP